MQGNDLASILAMALISRRSDMREGKKEDDDESGEDDDESGEEDGAWEDN